MPAGSRRDVWVREEGEVLKVGVTRALVESYKEFLYVEFLKKPGERFAEGEPLVALESLKSVYEVALPFGGEVVAVNEDVERDPSLINENPEETWLLAVKKA